MKKALMLALILALALACAAQAETIVDATGREVTVEGTPEHVVALLGSYGEVWLDAGGRLAATTEDAVDTPAALAQGDIANLGSHSEPNMELLLSLEPDFVILSADTAEHPAIAEVLEDAGIPYGFFSMQTWDGYMELLKSFTQLTGREDIYEDRVETVQKPIEAMIEAAKAQPEYGAKTALLLRTYATSVKAKGNSDTVAGPILTDMGLINLAETDSALTENLTMEAILVDDPDYIFVVAMGYDKEAAMNTLDETLLSNPAWNTLTAVQEGRYYVLDSDLFHYRPNAHWAESYAIIDELLYGAD